MYRTRLKTSRNGLTQAFLQGSTINMDTSETQCIQLDSYLVKILNKFQLCKSKT